MTSGIYMIENQVNGKIYIGQTSDLERRKKEHLNKLKNKTHHNLHLQNSFNKYGEDNFVFKIIKKNIPYYLLDSLEKRYIDIFQSNNNQYGYNLTSGGQNINFDKLSISCIEGKNKTGIEHVSVVKSNTYKSGYRFRFVVKNYTKNATTIDELERKINKDGYKFNIWDMDKYKKTLLFSDRIAMLLKTNCNECGVKNIAKVNNGFQYEKQENYNKTKIYKSNFYDLLKELINKNIKIKIININKVYEILKNEINDLFRIDNIMKQLVEVSV